VLDDPISSYGRGLWPTRYTAHERTSLSVQSKHDRRNVPLIWYWRYLGDRSPGGAAPDDTYYEAQDIYRQYEGPVGVHVLVDDTSKTKGSKKGAIETEGEVSLWISRAECIRLGHVFKTKDDREATLSEEERTDHDEGPYKADRYFFIPRAGDVFMFRRKLHRVAQFEPDYAQSLSPQGTVMTWKGTGSFLVMDATYPETVKKQFIPPTSDPVVPRTNRDVAWPG